MKNKVKELREGKGFKQVELAQSVGVSYQTIIAMEEGKYNPSLDVAMKTADFFDLTVNDVFYLSNP